MKIETTFDHAWFASDLLEQIIIKSSAGIRLPDVSTITTVDQPKKNSIWIRGTMDAAYTASVLLTVIIFFISVLLSRLNNAFVIVGFFLKGLLPMQLVFQATNKMMISDLLAAANEADILFHAEPSTQDFVTVRLTSFEKNAGIII